MDDLYFDIAGLVSKYLADDLTEEEKVRLMEWVELSEQNRSWFREVTGEAFVVRKRQELKAIDVKVGWEELSRKRHRGSRRYLGLSLLKYAGIFVLLAMATVYMLRNTESEPVDVVSELLPGGRKAFLFMADGSAVELNGTRSDTLREQDGTRIDLNGEGISYENPDSSVVREQLYNQLVVPRGGEYVLTLSDGTVVHLNADSKLRFPVKFGGDTRTVELDGEGYFQVSRNERVPFIVKTSGLDVTVLGTEFNVCAYAGHEDIQTTLVKGKVKVTPPGNHESRMLAPGEQAVYNVKEGKVTVTEVDVSYAIAWKDGGLRFRDRPLKEIMEVISRWYDVEVVYRDEEVKEYLFGCNFSRHATVLPLLELFQSTGTVHFDVHDKEIIISKCK